ncbi:MAG: endonuclease/exonuclease/phosphatase family protein [Clostridiales bacterium]|jgi:endonuclease/exonuclease/phosphatase family metal-dependent hydrolase|nr:endonuclease/exonuclease/phosphatase family protein [Clostridiales bacterium]
MRVMSFNVLCGGSGIKNYRKRRALVVERIKEINPDVLGVQEAHIQWMKTLTKGLRGYDYVGVGREDGKKDGEFSPVFYRKDMFEPIKSGTFWLSETPDIPSKGWGASCMRICSWCVLKHKQTGKEFVKMNTHLDHKKETARLEGVKLLLSKIEEFDMPVICTGDFNTHEDSEPYKIMTGGAMGDVKYIAKKTVSGNTFTGFDIEGTKGDSPIDYIFVKKDSVSVSEYNIATADIKGKQPSDHYAIYADIDFV